MVFHSDLHIHTFNSECCLDERQIPENIIPFLASMGYRKVGFTDHVWVSENVAVSKFYKKQRGAKILELKEYISSRQWEIEVLVGCEADMVAPGVFGMTSQFKDKVDYVVMASSHFHMKDYVAQPENETPESLGQHMLNFFISAAESGIPDILVHPFFPFGYVGLYDKAIAGLSDSELFDAFSIAAENVVGIEINRCYLPKPQAGRFFSLETPLRVLSIAKDAGCLFTLGSDSHNLEGFELLEKLQTLAASIGISQEDIHPLARID